MLFAIVGSCVLLSFGLSFPSLLSSDIGEYQSVVCVLLPRVLVVGSPVEVSLVRSKISVFVRGMLVVVGLVIFGSLEVAFVGPPRGRLVGDS